MFPYAFMNEPKFIMINLSRMIVLVVQDNKSKVHLKGDQWQSIFEINLVYKDIL